MKVLIICGSYPPDKCGIGDYTYRLCCDLKNNKNVEVAMLTSSLIIENGEETKIKTIKWNVFDICYVYKLINNIKFDVIHLQFPSSSYRKKIGIVLLILLVSLKYKIFITLHEFSDSPFIARMRTWPLILIADRIFVVDEGYKEHITSINKKYDSKIIKVNVGSNIPKNNLYGNLENMKNYRLNLAKDNEIILGYFGFINKAKGVETIVELGKLLKGNGKKFKIILIAELNNGNDYHTKLLKMIDCYDLKNDILVTGYLNEQEVANNIYVCDYMIYPFVNGISTKNTSYLASILQGTTTITTMPQRKTNKTKYHNTFFVEKYNDILGFYEIISNGKFESLINKKPLNIDINDISSEICESYKKYENLLI